MWAQQCAVDDVLQFIISPAAECTYSVVLRCIYARSPLHLRLLATAEDRGWCGCGDSIKAEWTECRLSATALLLLFLLWFALVAVGVVFVSTKPSPAMDNTHASVWIWIYIFSRQGPQTGASHRRAVVCEQLAQGCYLRVQWLRIEPTTSRSLGLTR